MTQHKIWTAPELIEALGCALRCSRAAGGLPRHVIADSANGWRVVATVANGDAVLIRDVISPRHTSEMISVSCEAEAEIAHAVPYVRRAVELCRNAENGRPRAPDQFDELMASLINTAIGWNEHYEKDAGTEYGRLPGSKPRSIWARMFGRAVF
jgi:hypothetical protein